MHEPKAVLTALAVALLLPQGAHAQLASRVEAGAVTTGAQGELGMNFFNVAPSARLDLPYGSLSARAAAWSAGHEWTVADAGVAGTVSSPTIYGIRADLMGAAARVFDDRSLGTDQVDIQTRIHLFLGDDAGVWVGGGVARPWRVGPVSSVDVAGAGAWARLGDATVSGTYTNFSFTRANESDAAAGTGRCSAAVEPVALTYGFGARAMFDAIPLSKGCTAHTGYGDLESVVKWEHRYVQVTAQAGYRFGSSTEISPDSRRWAAASVAAWLTNRVAVVMGGGRQPAMPMRGIPARTFGSMGMMLAYAPAARATVPVAASRAVMVRSFEVRPATHGMQKIVVRIGGVETIEVAGDFSDWSPLTLVRRGRDLWELTVPLEPGVHQINIRIDGGKWLAPPGMPTTRDGFNGEVGLLVVPG